MNCLNIIIKPEICCGCQEWKLKKTHERHRKPKCVADVLTYTSCVMTSNMSFGLFQKHTWHNISSVIKGIYGGGGWEYINIDASDGGADSVWNTQTGLKQTFQKCGWVEISVSVFLRNAHLNLNVTSVIERRVRISKKSSIYMVKQWGDGNDTALRQWEEDNFPILTAFFWGI